MAKYRGYERWNQSKERGNSMLAGTVSMQERRKQTGSA